MKTKIAKQATYWLGVVAIGLVVGLSIQFVTAWTEPSVSPPGGNVGAPVNTSVNLQTKLGNFIAQNLGSFNLTLVGKGSSASTVSADPGTTLVTKDYIDAQSGGGAKPEWAWAEGGTFTGRCSYEEGAASGYYYRSNTPTSATANCPTGKIIISAHSATIIGTDSCDGKGLMENAITFKREKSATYVGVDSKKLIAIGGGQTSCGPVSPGTYTFRPCLAILCQ